MINKITRIFMFYTLYAINLCQEDSITRITRKN